MPPAGSQLATALPAAMAPHLLQLLLLAPLSWVQWEGLGRVSVLPLP